MEERMADNLKKKGGDRELVSEQAYEVAYSRRSESRGTPRKGDGIFRQDIGATGLTDGLTPLRPTRSALEFMGALPN
ncbi:hypothetical protein CEJ86_32635 [Sinorhizobium meliloti]|uniref:Uncharacterized protein n=1 Tax=Rhizobium meliloti TaxID=382 RepID=A0A2J0YSW8_RHIML|nr:hypothetical protein CEJ86_32635 [Sinorhizobium meliloti]